MTAFNAPSRKIQEAVFPQSGLRRVGTGRVGQEGGKSEERIEADGRLILWPWAHAPSALGTGPSGLGGTHPSLTTLPPHPILSHSHPTPSHTPTPPNPILKATNGQRPHPHYTRTTCSTRSRTTCRTTSRTTSRMELNQTFCSDFGSSSRLAASRCGFCVRARDRGITRLACSM